MMNFIRDNKELLKRLFITAAPIMVQIGISNFVNMLDNVMIGLVGTLPMTGVSIANQLLFVLQLSIFGAVSGIGIFTAQFVGEGNQKGIYYTYRYKSWVVSIITALIIAVLCYWGSDLLQLFINEDKMKDAVLTSGEGAASTQVLSFALTYMWINFLGLWPFALSQGYAGTLRENNDTVFPMKVAFLAVSINLVLNYVLIFGKFGAPALGVAGAAWATVTARVAECLLLWLRLNLRRFKESHYHFMLPENRDYRPQPGFFMKVLRTAMALMVNECLWAIGMSTLMQCYSMRGLGAVASVTIAFTLYNVFNVANMALGNASGILLSQFLGANELEKARRSAWVFLKGAVSCCAVLGVLVACLSPFFPRIYNTTDEIKSMATVLIVIVGLFMPAHAYMNLCYYTLRSGGKVLITMLFDSCFVWSVAVPTAFLTSRFTSLSIAWIFFVVTATDFLKCAVGYILVKKGIWLHNIVKTPSA